MQSAALIPSKVVGHDVALSASISPNKSETNLNVRYSYLALMGRFPNCPSLFTELDYTYLGNFLVNHLFPMNNLFYF